MKIGQLLFFRQFCTPIFEPLPWPPKPVFENFTPNTKTPYAILSYAKRIFKIVWFDQKLLLSAFAHFHSFFDPPTLNPRVSPPKKKFKKFFGKTCFLTNIIHLKKNFENRTTFIFLGISFFPSGEPVPPTPKTGFSKVDP